MHAKQSKNRIDLGQHNRRLVLGEILSSRSIARSQIAENIGLTAASVSRITRDLLASGIIEEGEHFSDDSRAGRKFIGLSIKPDGCYVAGITINVFRQDIVVADFANNVIAQERLEFEDLADANKVIDHCAMRLNELIDESNINRNRLVGCGVAITGSVDPRNNILRSAPPLGWSETDVGRIVIRHLECPVYLDNIPNAKNIAAHCFGPTRQVDNVVLFNASLAIGCSIMIEGRVYRGAGYRAGLIESMMIPDFAGKRFLPVDQLAGGYAVIKNGDVSSQASQLENVFDTARSGGRAAIEALETAGAALACVVSNTFSLIQPDHVIISGPLMESDYYRQSLFDSLENIMGEEIANERVIYLAMSSQQAGQALAIYQSLMTTDLAMLPELQTLAS